MSRLIDADALRRWIEGECKSLSIPRNEAAFGKRILMHMEVMESEEAPTIEPEPHYDEWCTDCKEYDHERHCCPRFNRVIRETLEEIQAERKTGKWIPCSERLPEQYGNYLISIDGDGEEPDIGTIDPDGLREWSLCDANGFYWAHDKALNITAWMPLPEPYKEGEQND